MCYGYAYVGIKNTAPGITSGSCLLKNKVFSKVRSRLLHLLCHPFTIFFTNLKLTTLPIEACNHSLPITKNLKPYSINLFFLFSLLFFMSFCLFDGAKVQLFSQTAIIFYAVFCFFCLSFDVNQLIVFAHTCLG